MNESSPYDFIICGAGCSGLSLVMNMIRSGKFSDKKILLIDKDPKHANDRTWCFWQIGQGLFDPIIYRQWNYLWFHGDNFSRQLQIEPYHYNMIRGIDFYKYCFDAIRQQGNIDVLFEKVESVFSEKETGVLVNGRAIYADYVFNSILFDKPALRRNDHWLLQHFQGWIIETPTNFFDEKVATLMDFRVNQSFGTSFLYVLPFNSNKAMVEYTLFSREVLEKGQYEEALRLYIRDVLKVSNYRIFDKEFGIIPMTNFKFPSSHNKIINIGTAGGQTKGSSGYTFSFIQKHSKAITDAIIETGKPLVPPFSKRFNFYDSVLLKVLNDGKIPGKKIITDLFEKNDVRQVLRFLDNETNLAEELKIISGLPTRPFFEAGLRHII